MKKYVIIIVFTFIWVFSLSSQNKKKINVTGFDVSADDSHLLMTCYYENCGSVYLMNIKDSSVKMLIAGSMDRSYFNPRYSRDGKQILFIGYANKDVDNAALFIADEQGTNMKQLTGGNEIIKEAFFSKYDSTVIIFSKAQVYQKSSYLGMAQPHDMDLYSINYKNLEITKLTNFKAYSIQCISELDSSHFLMGMPGGVEGGMFLYQKTSRNLKRIVPANDPRKNPNFYYTPRYSEKFKKLAFTAPYELYIMELSTKDAKLLYRPEPVLKGIMSLSFFHYSPRLLIKVESVDGLYVIDLDGSNLKKVSIKLDK